MHDWSRCHPHSSGDAQGRDGIKAFEDRARQHVILEVAVCVHVLRKKNMMHPAQRVLVSIARRARTGFPAVKTFVRG